MEKNIMRPKSHDDRPALEKEFEERVIEIQRVSRVVKGGRRIRFRALVVIGNHKGKVGMGVAKANEVAEAVRKASEKAKKHLILIPIINGTIPHEITVKHGGAKVMFRPATEGTSIVAGGSVRTVSELAGITDLLAKSMGSPNKINNVLATLKAFQSFNPMVAKQVRKYSERLIEGKNLPNLDKETEKVSKNEAKEIEVSQTEVSKVEENLPVIEEAKKPAKAESKPAKTEDGAKPAAEKVSKTTKKTIKK
jgi:small subunit ribosomal protein S5